MNNKISKKENSDIIVAIPCYNEAATIQKVILDFKMEIPKAEIYVFDNNSNDGSARLAKEAGAIVYKVKKQGKGNVLKAIFDNIIADAVVIVDGDDTYFRIMKRTEVTQKCQDIKDSRA